MAVYLGNNKITFDGISEIYVGSNKVYSKSVPLTLADIPFYIENPGNSTITVPFVRVIASNNQSNTLEVNPSTTAWTGGVKYSTDMKNWTSSSSTNINIPAKTKMFFAAEGTGNDTSCGNTYYSSGFYAFFSSYVNCRMINFNNLTCNVGGNVLSLYYGTNFADKKLSITLSYTKSGTPNTWSWDPTTAGYGIPMAYADYANFGGFLLGSGYFSSSSFRCNLNLNVNNVNYKKLYLPFAGSNSLPAYSISDGNYKGFYHNTKWTDEPIAEISSGATPKLVGYMGREFSLVIRNADSIDASKVVNTSGYFYNIKSSYYPITIHMLPGQSITGLSSYSYISVVNDLDLTFSL